MSHQSTARRVSPWESSLLPFPPVTQPWPSFLLGRPPSFWGGLLPSGEASFLLGAPGSASCCCTQKISWPRTFTPLPQRPLPSHAGRAQLFLPCGKLFKGGHPGAPGGSAQVCLEHTHAHLQSMGSDSVGLGSQQTETLFCLSLSLYKMGVPAYVGASQREACRGRLSSQHSGISLQPPAHQAPLSHTLRERCPRWVWPAGPAKTPRPAPHQPQVCCLPVSKTQDAQPSGCRAGGLSSQDGSRQLCWQQVVTGTFSNLRAALLEQERLALALRRYFLPASSANGQAAGRGQWHSLLSILDGGHPPCHRDSRETEKG